MEIKLPDIDWKEKGWGLDDQIAKIYEEVGEFKNAGTGSELFQEILDVIQSAYTALDMVVDRCPLRSLINEIKVHNQKLVDRGYIPDPGPSYWEIIRAFQEGKTVVCVCDDGHCQANKPLTDFELPFYFCDRSVNTPRTFSIKEGGIE